MRVNEFTEFETPAVLFPDASRGLAPNQLGIVHDQRHRVDHVAPQDSVASVDDQELSAKHLAEKLQFEMDGWRKTSCAVESFQLIPADEFCRFDQTRDWCARQDRNVCSGYRSASRRCPQTRRWSASGLSPSPKARVDRKASRHAQASRASSTSIAKSFACSG